MKKLLSVLVALIVVLGLGTSAMAEGIGMAMVTDVGNIDDQSFNQGTWEGIVAYADEKALVSGTDYAYYRPSEDSEDARIESILTAIDKGAKVVVLPGYLFNTAVVTVAAQHPEIAFLGIDLDEVDLLPNIVNVKFSEEISGFFAGYAAVKDGYTKLGFLGGIDVPAVIRYGQGFVQGAEVAAKELGVKVDCKYWYSGAFWATDEIKAKMDSWYADGTEIVFACGGGILFSCLAAAESVSGKVIGVDTDQAYINELIITSAYKKLTVATTDLLKKLEANNGAWPADIAGQHVYLGINEGAVGIPTEAASWRFAKFTVEEYEAIFAKVKAGEIVISNDITQKAVVENVTVDYQN